MNHADRLELATQAAEMLAEVTWGLTAWVTRLDDMRDGGFPSSTGGDGGGHTSGHSSTVESRVMDPRSDPAARDLADVDSQIRKLHGQVLTLHRAYVCGVESRVAPPSMGNPGCEICTDASIPHTPAVYATAERDVMTVGKKGRKATTRKRVRMCDWCYQFEKRNGRLPNADEASAHANGRRVNVRVPA